MARTTVITGKQGPAFGDRASWTLIDVVDDDGSIFENSIRNWPSADRSDALRAVFEPFIQEERKSSILYGLTSIDDE